MMKSRVTGSETKEKIALRFVMCRGFRPRRRFYKRSRRLSTGRNLLGGPLARHRAGGSFAFTHVGWYFCVVEKYWVRRA